MSRNKSKQQHEGRNLYFPQGSLLNRMDIAVVESERRTSEYLKDPYVVYLVETRLSENAIDFEPGRALWRRYSDFELLRRYLSAMFPYIVMPVLPEKRLNVAKFQIAMHRFDPEFIERRRLGLECFLLRLASHPVISQDSVFRGFLNQNDGWKESVDATQWKQKLDNRLNVIAQNVSMGVVVKTPDERFEKIRNYSRFLEVNINAILKIQPRISAKTLSVMKQHSEYGKLFNEWSTMENDKGDLYHKVALQMDTLASQTINILKEDEIAYIDQLKEYFFLSGSLQSVVQKQDSLQHRLSKADVNLSAKSAQKEEVVKNIQLLEDDGELPSRTGLNSILSLVFGAKTLEMKHVKLLTLDEEVKEAETLVAVAEQDSNGFVEKALKDLGRFQKQKVRDVNKIMENYVQTQIKVNEIGLNQWKTMKEYFVDM